MVSTLILWTAVVATGAIAQVQTSTRDFSQALGGYTKGTLLQPDQLKNESTDFVRVFQGQDRGYGTLDLVTLIENTAVALRKEVPTAERLQVGDLSQSTGGKISGHGSHQNGLDVDLIYLRKDRRELDPKKATWFDEQFVTAQGSLTANFDLEANWALVRILHSSGRVQRIFVDAAIKEAFCAHATALGIRPQVTEILRSLRPWPAHDDHMHVRVVCPAASLTCVPQEEVDPGDGCPGP
ncbi:MAG: penicillin-insensitive murein endopeptidase [Bdellovibrionales bacterium]|nr:penicillin-insensitive murein endopeptidase [Bdellovibrionales bacterium]